MTFQQKTLIRESFALLKPMAVPVAMLFYGRLFELEPSLRRLFKNDMRLQSRKLMDTLDVVVESLDDFESLRPRLRKLGAEHEHYGAVPQHYNILVTALLWAFGQALQQDLPQDARAAWRIALDLVSAEMIAGAAESAAISGARV